MSGAVKVYPGQDLAPESAYNAGSGTTVFQNRIKSSLVGIQQISQEALDKPTISVVHNSLVGNAEAQTTRTSASLLPKVGDIVLARVTRINRLQANAQIIVIGESALVEDFQGIIRIADIRATEKDKVKVHSSFRPGDIVRAEVISLGDQSSYFLSTAKNELGVLFAWSEFGDLMYPTSWKEMRTEKGDAEERKVAKPFL